ncbi:MAG: NADPH-dependent FMN reductase [Pseudomonadota bacterium]
MRTVPFIVGLGGTTRPGSTSERALQVALARAASQGCDTLLLGGAQMPADIFDPTRPERSEAARLLVDALRRADGVVIATPAYHGGISGLVKNALDFTEDLRADDRVYLAGRAVGCIVCADGAQAMGSTLAALRAIVHALRGWPTPFGATLNAAAKPFGAPGQAADPAALQACELVADEVLQFVNWVHPRSACGAPPPGGSPSGPA